MNKAYKYRIYPNQGQEILINKTFGCVRFVYNKMLANRKEVYEQFKDDKDALKQQKYLLPADFKKEFEWLKEVDSLALANAQLNLQTAYKNFFRDKSIGFPKFKSKHHDKKSYTTNNQNGTIRLIDSKTIRLPKLKDVRIKLHRELPKEAVIKSATISKTPTGKYYISVLIEYESNIVPVTPVPETVLGLDYSSKSLFIDSKANTADYVFISRKGDNKPITRQQAYRILNNAAESLGLVERDANGTIILGEIGTHTLRKTFGYHAYKSGITIELLMDLFNHSSKSQTLRYIGITEDQKKDVYLQSNLG